MHRIPLVPAHDDARNRDAGAAATERAARWNRNSNAAGRARAASWNGHAGARHAHTRPPRVLVAWQRRIGRFFGADLG